MMDEQQDDEHDFQSRVDSPQPIHKVKVDRPEPIRERAIFIELVLVSGQRCEIIIHPERDETYDDTHPDYWLFEYPKAKAVQRVWKAQIASDTIRDSFVETPAVIPERKARDGRRQ